MPITVTVTGKSGTNVTATSGDTVNVTLSPTGTPGGVGPQGPAGPATSLSIGNVFSGDTAGAAITGTAPNQVLSLTLPKGDKGAKGDTGASGATGATGPAGPANSLSIGTVTSGTAAATITGTAPNQTLNLTLPAGPKGDTGATGPAGPANTLTIGVVNSGSIPSAAITGTAPNQVLNLVLARGETGLTGATGAAGPANTLTIGSVTEGSSAGASITGTAPNQTLNLTIPATTLSIGTVTTGAAGSSASATVTGTAPAQTINLTIPRGDKGDTGATGSAGATGPAGPANSLTIGTVTTGAAGSSASATITGTAPTQTLNLTIPRGDKGDAGSGGGSFSWSSVPATSSSSGTAGNVAYDGSRLYVCTATNTWRAAALSRWDADPYWTSVSLLLRFDGSGSTFTDLSSSPKTITAFGNATQSTTQSKFGGKSLYLDGTGDYLTIASNAAFGFGTGDFTIECWYYPTQNVGNEAIVDLRTSDAVQWLWFGKSSGGALRTYDAANVRTGGSVNLNAWNHVAWSRVGATNSVYLNGTRVIDWTNGGDVGSTRPVTIGANADGSLEQSNAYIDELRITKGIGRYSGSTLTQPTAEFPDY